MKERPILFSGPMIRAILEGRKTQTRRVLKKWPGLRPFTPEVEGGRVVWKLSGEGYVPGIVCPYGAPGDCLWVRETWLPFDRDHVFNGKRFAYRADQRPGDCESERCREEMGYKWHPSIFMKREASRITLEITEVRVERLQEISEEDAKAEGCEIGCEYVGGRCNSSRCAAKHYRAGYRLLWDSINGEKHPWEKNEWVWCITFRKL